MVSKNFELPFPRSERISRTTLTCLLRTTGYETDPAESAHNGRRPQVIRVRLDSIKAAVPLTAIRV